MTKQTETDKETNLQKKETFDDYKETIDEFITKVSPQIFKEDYLPGFSRPTLAQIDKHLKQLTNSNKDIALTVIAYGVILGETMVRTIEGAEWMYEAPSIEMVRIKLPIDTDQGDSAYSLPILRALQYYRTRLSEKSIVTHYDNIKRAVEDGLLENQKQTQIIT